MTGLRQCFPLDVTTLPGLAGCIAVVLSAKGLSRDLIVSAHKVIKALCEATLISTTLRLLPDCEVCWIEVVSGKNQKRDIKQMLERIGVQYCRPDV